MGASVRTDSSHVDLGVHSRRERSEEFTNQSESVCVSPRLPFLTTDNRQLIRTGSP